MLYYNGNRQYQGLYCLRSRPTSEIKVTFGEAMNTINSTHDGFTFSGQLGTDYDYNNETLKVEFKFNTDSGMLTVPTEK